MDVTFSPEASAAWHGLSDLEQMRVELVVRRMSASQVRDSGGEFAVGSYDLEISGHISPGGYPILVRTLRRSAPGIPQLRNFITVR